MLILNGSKDTQVDADLNLKLFEKMKDKQKVDVIRYEGLNHLFQHCTTGLPLEYGQIEETIAPQVLKDISDWIIRTTQGKK